MADWVFYVDTDRIDIDDDETFDALYDVGLGSSFHPHDQDRTELCFDFADERHPHPGDELGAEVVVRPVLERLGLTIYRWWREDMGAA